MLKQFLETHIVYPVAALKSKAEGKVVINFTADEDGKIVNRAIEQSPSSLLDTEALRLFDLIEWNPALADGAAKKGSGELTIDFKIKKYNKAVKRRGYKEIARSYPIDSSLRIYSRKELDTVAQSALAGGNKNLYSYIYSQMQYPKQASDLNIEGRVELSLIIEKNGLPSNIVVNQTVGGGCTEEAVRITNTIKWNPAIKNGLAVRSRQKLFIEFRLDGNNGGEYIPNQTNSGF